MDLLIALFLILVVGTKVGVEKASASNSKWQRQQEQEKVDRWNSYYVDKELEETLQSYINEPSNYEDIRREINPILSTMPSCRYLLSYDFPINDEQVYHRRDCRIARNEYEMYQPMVLNLLLANRGKVSSWAAMFGYPSYLMHGTVQLKEQSFEITKTISKLLAYKGIKLELTYGRKQGEFDGHYYWKGSFGSNAHVGSQMMPFDREILLKNVIPPSHNL